MPTSPPLPESPDIKRPRLIQSSATYPPPCSSADRLPCPRCNSTATKFCYYNNYNLSQPRHFCKGCRRYWTRGGTLRDVPVGGGTRKSGKRAKLLSHRLNGASPSNSSSSSSLTHETAPNKPTFDSAVEKPDLPSVQHQQQLLNLNDNITGEGELSFSSMLMINDNNSTPGFLSLGGYGYGSGIVHGFQQGYGCGTRASGVDFPAEMSGGLGYGSGFLYGAPVATVSGFDINMWQMAAAADHGGQGGGLVDSSEIQILNSTPAVTGGGALKEEKVADSSTSACLNSLHLEY